MSLETKGGALVMTNEIESGPLLRRFGMRVCGQPG